MKIIFFNGPPRSGKDTAARVAADFIPRKKFTPYIYKMSGCIKRAFAGLMDTEIREDYIVKDFELFKEKKIDDLGVSYRQWQIDFSEKFMKPLYGEDIFARLFWKEIMDQAGRFPVILVSDCGFQIEYDYLSEKADCTVVQIHRPGCTFKGDSRQWVNGSFTIQNDGALFEFGVKVCVTMGVILKL